MVFENFKNSPILKRSQKNVKEKQLEITISESDSIWRMLAARYNATEVTHIFENLAKSEDLKVVLRQGLKQLEEQISILKNLTKEYGIPMPLKHESSDVPFKTELITDRSIYTHIFKDIQACLHMLVTAFEKVAPLSYVISLNDL